MWQGFSSPPWTRLHTVLWICLMRLSVGQIRYSIPEEMSKGSVIGNIANDLGIELKRLVSGKARVFTSDGSEYVGLDKEKGQLLVKQRMDREQLCSQDSACSLTFEVVLEKPMELYSVNIDIQDVNDNSPAFSVSETEQEISESALPGSRFPLDGAIDLDVGINTLQKYVLHPTDHFDLNVQSRSDGPKTVEMVLKTALDREKKKQHYLTLTAFDGGHPQKSGTVKIHITVIDHNDNAPVFMQKLYKASVSENSPSTTLVTTVKATDVDEGTNSNVEYYFKHAPSNFMPLFAIDSESGEIRVTGPIDYEKNKQLQIEVIAKDAGGLKDSCEVNIEITDVNDNVPKITLMSFSSEIPENAEPGTVVAMLNVQDIDSGDNGKVTCSVDRHSPFKIVPSLTSYYNLVTDSALDREQVSEYNITINAVDAGNPPLSSRETLTVKISDTNDNAPEFEKTVYNVYVQENNLPSLSIFSVKAQDADWGPNARVSYFIDHATLNGVSVSPSISVNVDTGVIYAMKPFDYEQIKSLRIKIKARDGGTPPLSANATLNIFIQDQNDNAPQVLYPVQAGGSVVAEIVPRSADIGYLVTKVVAVDVDSGQNAWLSYKLQKPADRPLFEVGVHNGEIRTVRQVTDKDAVKQKLTVAVEDNGQPSRSAVVNVNVAVADSFPEVISEFSDFTHDKEYNDALTFYLILALIVVSILFIFSIITIITVKIYRWRQRKSFYKSDNNLPVIPYYPTMSDATMQHVYNYDVCGTTDSRMSDVKRIRPYSQNTLVSLSRPGTVHRERRQHEEGEFTLEVSRALKCPK